MNPYAGMNTTGWTTDPEIAIASIFADYCAVEYSGTKLYYKKIRSLPYQIMRVTEPSELAAIIQDDLMYIYKCSFDAVECNVIYDDQNQVDGPDTARYALTISLIITDGNRRYSLGKVLEIKNSSIMEIRELNQ